MKLSNKVHCIIFISTTFFKSLETYIKNKYSFCKSIITIGKIIIKQLQICCVCLRSKSFLCTSFHTHMYVYKLSILLIRLYVGNKNRQISSYKSPFLVGFRFRVFPRHIHLESQILEWAMRTSEAPTSKLEKFLSNYVK